MLCHFYDIESLPNVFTLALYAPESNSVDIYILDDTGFAFNPAQPSQMNPQFAAIIEDAIHNANRSNFADGNVRICDLRQKEISFELAQRMGAPIKDSQNWNADTYFVTDTDDEYDPEIHPYLMGYNSFNYDTTMLAIYFDEAWPAVENEKSLYSRFNPTLSAATLRSHNDELFNPALKNQMTAYLTCIFNEHGDILYDSDDEIMRDWNTRRNIIRQSMMTSGRHVDVARLNEKQRKVGLKRLLGLIGCQILESEFSAVVSVEALASLVAYNVSDVVNLYELYQEGAYSGQFATKRNMLTTYPELVYEYEKEYNEYGRPTDNYLRDEHGKLIISQKPRRNRLYTDSTSQQLASRTLCPEGHLHDKQFVSLVYPAAEKAAQIGKQPFDVLDMARDFYKERILDKLADGPIKDAAAKQFQTLYDTYSTVRGHNFNSSQDYKSLYSPNAEPTVDILKKVPTTCLIYLDANGEPTSCYVTFSTGGIHGAEYNKQLYDADMKAYKEEHANLTCVQNAFGADDEGAVRLRNSVKRAKDPIDLEFPDKKQHQVKEFLRSGFTKTSASWKTLTEPQLFITSPKTGSMSLNKKYVFTSAGLANHEDFTSYYPGLLRQMDVFANPDLGYDRYGEIFDGKQRYGIIMKDKNRSEEERKFARDQRENVKLILNSASGGGDASFDTPILMNNNIISMRLIGQLFSWLIGQAQTIAGARVPSTNTDGLYTMDLDEELNNEILAKESANINVPIEPEPIRIISKDANNRIEYTLNKETFTYKIEAASGDVACWRGPDTRKSLDHPAVIDWALVHYLIRTVEACGGQKALFEPFDEELGRSILTEALDQGGHTHRLMMFQNIVASSPGKFNFITALHDDDTLEPLQHYNRVFMLKEGLENTVSLRQVSGTLITNAVANRRKKDGQRQFQDDTKAIDVMTANGVSIRDLHKLGREVTIRKVSGIDLDCPILIVNNSIRNMPHEQSEKILASLDLDRYLALLKSAYENNWRNKRAEIATDEITESEQ